jgi:hypothetical protein
VILNSRLATSMAKQDLKDKMEKAGVEGKSPSFFYNIVKMYQ